jgi:hypothetical protein
MFRPNDPSPLMHALKCYRHDSAACVRIINLFCRYQRSRLEQRDYTEVDEETGQTPFHILALNPPSDRDTRRDIVEKLSTVLGISTLTPDKVYNKTALEYAQVYFDSKNF